MPINPLSVRQPSAVLSTPPSHHIKLRTPHDTIATLTLLYLSQFCCHDLCIVLSSPRISVYNTIPHSLLRDTVLFLYNIITFSITTIRHRSSRPHYLHALTTPAHITPPPYLHNWRRSANSFSSPPPQQHQSLNTGATPLTPSPFQAQTNDTANVLKNVF